MPVEDPGVLQVTCDECGAEIEANTTEYVGTPASWGVDEQTILDLGWSVDGSETFCTECTEAKQDADQG